MKIFLKKLHISVSFSIIFTLPQTSANYSKFSGFAPSYNFVPIIVKGPTKHSADASQPIFLDCITDKILWSLKYTQKWENLHLRITCFESILMLISASYLLSLFQIFNSFCRSKLNSELMPSRLAFARIINDKEILSFALAIIFFNFSWLSAVKNSNEYTNMAF